jgi:hypothetical protein
MVGSNFATYGDSMSCLRCWSPYVLLSAFGAVILVISARFPGELESLLLQVTWVVHKWQSCFQVRTKLSRLVIPFTNIAPDHVGKEDIMLDKRTQFGPNLIEQLVPQMTLRMCWSIHNWG